MHRFATHPYEESWDWRIITRSTDSPANRVHSITRMMVSPTCCVDAPPPPPLRTRPLHSRPQSGSRGEGIEGGRGLRVTGAVGKGAGIRPPSLIGCNPGSKDGGGRPRARAYNPTQGVATTPMEAGVRSPAARRTPRTRPYPLPNPKRPGGAGAARRGRRGRGHCPGQIGHFRILSQSGLTRSAQGRTTNRVQRQPWPGPADYSPSVGRSGPHRSGVTRSVGQEKKSTDPATPPAPPLATHFRHESTVDATPAVKSPRWAAAWAPPPPSLLCSSLALGGAATRCCGFCAEVRWSLAAWWMCRPLQCLPGAWRAAAAPNSNTITCAMR